MSGHSIDESAIWTTAQITLLASTLWKKNRSNFLKLKKPGVVLLRSEISRIRSDCKKLAESWYRGRFRSGHDSMLAFHNGRLLALRRSRCYYCEWNARPARLCIFPYVTMNGIMNNFFIGRAIRSRLVPCTWRNVCIRARHGRIKVSQLDFSSFDNVIS